MSVRRPFSYRSVQPPHSLQNSKMLSSTILTATVLFAPRLLAMPYHLPSLVPRQTLDDLDRSGNWTTVQCTAGTLVDARYNYLEPNQRWLDGAAPDAWQNLVNVCATSEKSAWRRMLIA